MTGNGLHGELRKRGRRRPEEVYILTVNSAGEIYFCPWRKRHETRTCRKPWPCWRWGGVGLENSACRGLSSELCAVIEESQAFFEARGPIRARASAPGRHRPLEPAGELCRRRPAAYGDRHHHRRFYTLLGDLWDEGAARRAAMPDCCAACSGCRDGDALSGQVCLALRLVPQELGQLSMKG